MERLKSIDQLKENAVFYIMNGAEIKKYKFLWMSPDSETIYASSTAYGNVSGFSAQMLLDNEETDTKTFIGKYDGRFLLDIKIDYHYKQIDKLKKQKEMLFAETNLV